VGRAPAHGHGQGGASSVRWAARVVRRSTRLWSVAAVVGVGVGAGALWVVRHQGSSAGPGARMSPPSVAAPLPPEASRSADRAAAAPTLAPVEVSMAPAAPIVHAAPRLRSRRTIAMASRAMVSRPNETNTGAEGDGEGRRGEAGEPSRGPAPAPIAPGATPAPPQASPAAAPARPQPVAAATGPRPAPRSPPDPGGDSSGAEEASLLRSASQSLATSPARTLSLTDEHRLRYPHGILDQEREALAIEALIKLGRRDEALARARAFARAYPTSPHRARVERTLGPSPGTDGAP